uniref:Uncharacterized protein n=1 Tax=Romanomermis culicivorax TaxID=13658 RepID=A0A915I4Y2_ROMCU
MPDILPRCIYFFGSSAVTQISCRVWIVVRSNPDFVGCQQMTIFASAFSNNGPITYDQDCDNADNRNVMQSTERHVPALIFGAVVFAPAISLPAVLAKALSVGGYRKPNPLDLLVVRIIIFPYTAFLYVTWYSRWIWKFNIKREEFGIEEKHFIIRKNMSLSESQFQCLEESEIENFMDEELWIKENFEHWKKNKEERERAALAENAQHKRYRSRVMYDRFIYSSDAGVHESAHLHSGRTIVFSAQFEEI